MMQGESIRLSPRFTCVSQRHQSGDETLFDVTHHTQGWSISTYAEASQVEKLLGLTDPGYLSDKVTLETAKVWPGGSETSETKRCYIAHIRKIHNLIRYFAKNRRL